MITTTEAACASLREQGIEFTRYDHLPVATCEEAAVHLKGVEGAGSKNLFLRNKKGDRHFLVTVHEDTRVDLAKLSEVLGVGRLSFASADRLERYLGVKPGAVTILALVNDATCSVEPFVDKSLWEYPLVQCHPMENTATLVLSPRAIEAYVESFGRKVSMIDVPGVWG
jgi:Ala-tRNA(Pro) deacylase